MDVYDIVKRSSVMRQVKGSNTGPELVIRRLLHRNGFRYRLHRVDLPGKPDIVFPGRHKIILVHGCYWHQHPGCPHSARPSSNVQYWNKKLDRNIVRDLANLAALQYAGWKVFVVWECQTKQVDELMPNLLEFLDS